MLHSVRMSLGIYPEVWPKSDDFKKNMLAIMIKVTKILTKNMKNILAIMIKISKQVGIHCKTYRKQKPNSKFFSALHLLKNPNTSLKNLPSEWFPVIIIITMINYNGYQLPIWSLCHLMVLLVLVVASLSFISHKQTILSQLVALLPTLWFPFVKQSC